MLPSVRALSAQKEETGTRHMACLCKHKRSRNVRMLRFTDHQKIFTTAHLLPECLFTLCVYDAMCTRSVESAQRGNDRTLPRWICFCFFVECPRSLRRLYKRNRHMRSENSRGRAAWITKVNEHFTQLIPRDVVLYVTEGFRQLAPWTTKADNTSKHNNHTCVM